MKLTYARLYLLKTDEYICDTELTKGDADREFNRG